MSVSCRPDPFYEFHSLHPTCLLVHQHLLVVAATFLLFHLHFCCQQNPTSGPQNAQIPYMDLSEKRIHLKL